MKNMRAVAAAAFVLFSVRALADDQDAVARAQAAATKCMTLIDGATYGQSWDEAALFLKSVVAKSDWERAMKGVRAPLGAVKTRELKSATFTRSLPGVPDGEYVVVQFETKFENRTVIETVTPMLESDGSWRVAGYRVK